MKEILEHIIKELVTNKDEVVIKEDVSGNFIRFTVGVNQNDYGKIIGHEGKIAKSIRTLMGAIATVKNVKVVVDIR